MSNQSRTFPRPAWIALIVVAVVGMGGLTVGGILVATNLLRVAEPVEAKPGVDIFEALRLDDRDVQYLGLDASESGHTPSTLATAASRLQSEWTGAKGVPAECMFAGAYPGDAVAPVWGTEDDATELWTEKSVSATQTLRLAGDVAPFITLTSRVFEDDQAALTFLLDHNDAVPGCPSFDIVVMQRTMTTTLTPLLVNTLQVSNTGWVAETAQWLPVGMPEESAIDMQCWVLNMQQGNVVERMTMMVPADMEADAGPFFTELASVVAANLAATVATD